MKGEFAGQLPQSIAKLPAVYMRAFLIQKQFYCLTNQTQEVRELDHRVSRLTFPRYCLVMSSIKGEYFNLIRGHSNSNMADVYLFVNEITF